MERKRSTLVQTLPESSPLRIFVVVLVIALIAGVGTGYALAKTGNKNSGTLSSGGGEPASSPKSAAQDNQTFRDFAEGTIQPKPSPKDGEDDYSDGQYLLVRSGADPVALTSSVVDLSKYVGKKVKVYGETQKALKAGWLMDVGKVDVE